MLLVSKQKKASVLLEEAERSSPEATTCVEGWKAEQGTHCQKPRSLACLHAPQRSLQRSAPCSTSVGSRNTTVLSGERITSEKANYRVLLKKKSCHIRTDEAACCRATSYKGRGQSSSTTSRMMRLPYLGTFTTAKRWGRARPGQEVTAEGCQELCYFSEACGWRQPAALLGNSYLLCFIKSSSTGVLTGSS